MRRVGVDSGGTFTDICLVDEATGDVRVWKVPSTPDDPSRAIADGAVEGLREAARAEAAAVRYFGHGTTVATNTLIQHGGAPTGLVTTEGFRDLLEIGRQRRPHLYDLQADKPPRLVPRHLRAEVTERLRHDGRVEKRRLHVRGPVRHRRDPRREGLPDAHRGEGRRDLPALRQPAAGARGPQPRVDRPARHRLPRRQDARGPEIPANAGLFRPIHVSAPEGTMLNCVAPAAVNSRTQTCQRVVDLIHGALAPAIPDRIIAACNGACVSSTFSGVNPRTGAFYVYLETIGGGFGARATRDGLDGVHVHITNTSNLPVEALEAEYPLVVERYALVEDAGGPGTWRGGLGIVREIRAEDHDCHAFVHAARRRSAPWGLFGGHDGGRARIAYGPGVEPPVRAQGFLRPGQSVAIVTPGAGGYGDPRARDRSLVRRDLADGVISREVAHDVYGLTEDAR